MIEIHQGRGLRRLEEKSNQTFYNWIERMIVVLLMISLLKLSKVDFSQVGVYSMG